ncbi:MAG: 3-dehydroquinate synthase [Pseudomonadota bacterium]|nr:3-dehydroquinate synthase [Pseudomonadota bacterium]
MGSIKKIQIDLKDNPYEIIIGSKLIDELPDILSNFLGRKNIYIICDEGIGSIILPKIRNVLDKSGYNVFVSLIPSGESSKNFKIVENTISELLDKGIERSDALIALGGGVIGDLTGFISSIIFRGIDFIQIPTTLLAQVDSSVGGKTAINVQQGKNLVGTFHQPKIVISDVSLLSSLPEREIKCGLAEIIKYSVLGDRNFFDWLVNNRNDLLNLNQEKLTLAVENSCSMKSKIVQNDEFEKGERALLNLGHTFGHAIEKHFSDTDLLLHGEAISIGMAFAAKFSSSHGELSQMECEELINLLKDYSLPTSLEDIDGKISQDEIMKLMKHDKKRINEKNTLILLKEIGKAYISNDIDDEDLVNFFSQEKIK